MKFPCNAGRTGTELIRGESHCCDIPTLVEGMAIHLSKSNVQSVPHTEHP